MENAEKLSTHHDRRGRFHAFAVVALGLLTLPIFLYTVHLRAPWFGVLSDHPLGHQWLTGGTVKFSRNWYREGIFHLRFAMIESPASVEFPTLKSRDPYASYPPGSVLPIYLLARVLGREPNPPMVMAYNLANHCLIAWLLGVTAYVVLLRAGIPPLNGLLFAAVCPCIELLCPAPLYFLQNVYAMDMAVILPFVVCLLLESLRPAVSNRRLSRVLAAAQWCVFFAGYLTDWLFVFVGLVIYLKRLLSGELVVQGRGTGSSFRPPTLGIAPKAEKRASPLTAAVAPTSGPLRSLLTRSLWYWSPAAAAGSLFVAQLTYLGWWGTLYEHFRHRIGATAEEGRATYGEFLVNYFRQYLPLGYGGVGSCLLGGSLLLLLALLAYAFVARLRRRSIAPTLAMLAGFMAVTILPGCLQTLVLWEHSGHTFSLVKFSVPVALIPFALAPAVGIALMSKEARPATPEGDSSMPAAERGGARKPPKVGRENCDSPRKPRSPRRRFFSPRIAGLNFAVLLAAGVYLSGLHPLWLSCFPKPTPYFEELATAFRRAGIGYRDILVSPDFEIPENPPQCLALTMKRVYLCYDRPQLAELVAGVEPPLRIVGLWVRGNTLRMHAWEVATASELPGRLDEVARRLDGRDAAESEIASYPGYTVHFSDGRLGLNLFAADLLAREQYREVIHVLAPGQSGLLDSADRRCCLATAFARLGRRQEAIGQFESALRINPNLAVVHFRLGDLLTVSNPRLAAEHYRAGLRLEPDNANGLNGLGVVFARSGQIGQAILLFRQALESDPSNPAARGNLEAALRMRSMAPGHLPER